MLSGLSHLLAGGTTSKFILVRLVSFCLLNAELKELSVKRSELCSSEPHEQKFTDELIVKS